MLLLRGGKINAKDRAAKVSKNGKGQPKWVGRTRRTTTPTGPFNPSNPHPRNAISTTNLN